MWLALLYSIMCFTTASNLGIGTEQGAWRSSKPNTSHPEYLEQLIDCLILGDYSRGGPHAMEALLNYCLFEHVRRRDPDTRNWSLLGVILRLAFRMGCHLEPSRFPVISPFQGELRRRLWMMLYGMDMVFSLQMGMPRMIKDENSDIMPARNLFDTDFDEDTMELPPSRPFGEITPMSFWLARHEFMVIMASIADLAISTTVTNEPCSEQKMRHLDELLRNTYERLPGGIKFTSISACLFATSEDISNRLSLAVILRKCLIILHYRHVIGGTTNGQEHSPAGAPQMKVSCGCSSEFCAESVRKCVDAAMQLLEYQDLIHCETASGGALASQGWRLSASTILHEFLMATSVLCKYLYSISKSQSVDGASKDSEVVLNVKAALLRANNMLQSQSHSSRDAEKTANKLGALLNMLQVYNHNENAPLPATTPDDLTDFSLACWPLMNQDSFMDERNLFFL
nr:fungal specific transcription factor [Colletotrichum truncatum]KAF6790218.1 fungal specific transcription factor [Colletotrichum truncatum]